MHEITTPDPQLISQAHAIAAELSDAERGVLMISVRQPALICPADAFALITAARHDKTSSGSALAAAVGETAVLRFVADALGYRLVDLADASTAWKVDDALIQDLDVAHLSERVALPVRSTSGELFVACANPLASPDVVDMVSDVAGARARAAIGIREQIEAKLIHVVSADLNAFTDQATEQPQEQQTSPVVLSPVVEWADNMFARAHADRVSDVHLQFRSNGSLWMRWRIDGELADQPFPLRGREQELISSLLARCKTTNQNDLRRPQDGAFGFKVAGGRTVDARLSMMPQVHGPYVVVRLLDPANVQRPLNKMGFSARALEAIRRAIASPQGMVFVIGPTGSGKSTTLYGMLYEIDKTSRNVLAAEDPVEYRMPGVGQTEIRENLAEDRALTFEGALRGFMRLDPDVIMLGEVRDAVTAKVALNAALTGHLVLSTTHANSALGVFHRLYELKVEPYSAAEAISLAVSQRLVRRLHSCAILSAPTAEDVRLLTSQGLPVPEQVASPRPGGCAMCRGTGFFGRLPVAEVLEPNQHVRDLVVARASTAGLVEAAVAEGWVPIMADAFDHVQNLTIPVSELRRCLDGVVR